jgi:DNA primase
MDAIQLIKEHLDVERILKYYDFDGAKPSGNKIRSCCKIHDGNNPTGFVIDVDTGLWSCHTSDCGSGDIFHLVQRLEDIGFPVAVHKVADVLGLDIGNLEIVARTKQERKELRDFLDAIKRAQQKELQAYTPEGTAVNVKKFKEFQSSTIEHFGLTFFKTFIGVNSKGEPITLFDRLGFPIIQEGKQVGFSLRATRQGEIPKWIHQPTDLEVRGLLYNYDAVLGEPVVVVVEGITDVWAYHEIGIPAVAIYGSHISKEQVRLLLRLGCDLIFSFDGDIAGRSAMKKAYDTFKLTSNIRFVILPDGQDPESIPREELWKHYETKRHYPL